MFSMQRFHNAKTDGAQFEKKAVQLFVLVSLGVHVFFFAVDPSQWFFRSPPPLNPEWEIETELISELTDPAPKPGPPPPQLTPPKPQAGADDESTVDKNLLPQLPKKFTIKEEEKEILPDDKEKITTSKPEGDKPEPKKEDEQQLVKKKDDEATEIFKKDLMERLLKEQKRQDKKAAKEKEKRDKDKQAVAQKLAELRREAELSPSSGQIDETHPYIVAVKGFIYDNYSIPEVYNFEETHPPIVLFVVNSSGNLVKFEITQSSNNIALDRYALQSLEQAATFFPKPPPPEIIGRPIQIRFMRKI